MSDLTRGNLVFGSLNSKRSRVSLARRGERQEGGRERKEDDEAKLDEGERRGGLRTVCGPWSQRGTREGGNETSDSGRLDSAIGWGGGMGREGNGGERQSRVARTGNDGERWGRASGKGRERSPEAAGCLSSSSLGQRREET